MATSARYNVMKKVYGEEKFSRIWNAKLLVVGAGGIGCELLKNLALLGFHYVELIDLDTIDVSNLNRQFLFRPQHVGHPKAVVAAEAAMRFNPDFQVIAHHANIKDSKFNISYFSKFDLVLNALDNVDARRHVNRLCLAADVPLFDSGTTGYLGQVMPILKGYTTCYECLPKPTQKVYPICTIRSTPDKPVHCIVWAKECLKLLFAKASDSMLYEDEEGSGDKSEYMSLITIPNDAATSTETLLPFVRELLIGLFHKEVQKRIDMEVYKTAKAVPVPLAIDVIDEAMNTARDVIENTNGQTAPSIGSNWDQRVWTMKDCLVEFTLAYVDALKEPGSIGSLSFDKDDIWSMKFVTAASNIRSAIFSIPTLSFHDAKGVAGNIIPAIATTNAIIAASQVAEAVKFLTNFTKKELFNPAGGDAEKAEIKKTINKVFPQVYCLRFPTRKGVFLQPTSSDEPMTTCYVCGKSQLSLQIDVTETTLQDLVTKVLKGKLGFNEPSIGAGANIFYEEGEDCDEELKDNLPLKLNQCPGGGVVDGTVLTIDDFSQNLNLDLVIKHLSNEELAKIESAAADLFILEGREAFEKRQQEEANKEKEGTEGSSTNAAATAAVATGNEDDMIVIMDDEVQHVEAARSGDNKKRSVDNLEVEEQDPKKAKK